MWNSTDGFTRLDFPQVMANHAADERIPSLRQANVFCFGEDLSDLSNRFRVVRLNPPSPPFSICNSKVLMLSASSSKSSVDSDSDSAVADCDFESSSESLSGRCRSDPDSVSGNAYSDIRATRSSFSLVASDSSSQSDLESDSRMRFRLEREVVWWSTRMPSALS